MFGRLIGRALLILAFVLFSLPVYADSGSYHLSVNSGSTLWIHGNSTLHKYEIKTSTFNLTTDPITMSSSNALDVSSLLAQISGNFVLVIPVEKLHNPEAGFDHNVRRALKYKQNPNIVFSLTSATATPDPSAAGSYNVSAQGNLSIAGQEKPESLSTVFAVQGNTIKITGTKDLLMTDFGVKPPTMFFGAIKTDDQITIQWDLTLSSQ